MEDKEYTGYSVSVYNQHTEDSAEGEAENSQAKGPDTGRYSGEHSTEEAKSFRSKDRAHEHLLFVRFHSLILLRTRQFHEGGNDYGNRSSRGGFVKNTSL